MTNLYEVLENCLEEIEQGADIETVLFRYPDLAEELRPILEASIDAENMAAPFPSFEVIQRNRARVLGHAAQLREAKAKSSHRIWFSSLRRLAVTVAVVAVLFASGTGLVRAASTTLPGDQLYPVKRTWEDMLVALAFNVQQRDALEIEHENERIQEVHDVFAEGRSVSVEFAGTIMSQNGSQWVISNIPVMISAQTEMPSQGLTIGSAVRVKGQTQNNNMVVAHSIELLPSNAILPDLGDQPEIEKENHKGPTPEIEDNSGKGSEGETTNVEDSKAPQATAESGKDGSGDLSHDSGSDSGHGTESDSHNQTPEPGGGTDSGSGSDGGSSHDG